MIAVMWSIMTLYPLIWTFLSSLKTNNEIFGKPFNLPTIFHFEYYMDALVKANMAQCLFNSLIITSATTFLVVAISSMAAYVLARFTFKWINYIYLYFIAGVIVPIHSCLVPLVRMISAVNGQNNYPIIILLYTAFNLPVAVFLITGFMKGIPKELDEAATIDGCGPFSLLFKILLPVASPILATAAILTFLFTYNELIFAVLFISKRSLYTISLGLLSFIGFRAINYGPTFAGVIIAVIPMIVIYTLFQERVEKGLSAGAVKG